VKKDLVELGLHTECALDRVSRRGLMLNPSDQCKHGQRTLNGDDDDNDALHIY